MRKESGFTLVESIVVLCILSICVGTAVPSLAPLMERQRTTTAMNSLLTHMAEARMAAISRRQGAVLCPSRDGASCSDSTDWSGGWLVFIDRDADRQVGPRDEVLRVDGGAANGRLVVRVTGGRTSLRYLPDGRAAGTNLTISMCNTRGDLLGSVIVNNAGRARTERPKTATRCPA